MLAPLRLSSTEYASKCFISHSASHHTGIRQVSTPALLPQCPRAPTHAAAPCAAPQRCSAPARQRPGLPAPSRPRTGPPGRPADAAIMDEAATHVPTQAVAACTSSPGELSLRPLCSQGAVRTTQSRPVARRAGGREWLLCEIAPVISGPVCGPVLAAGGMRDASPSEGKGVGTRVN